MTESDITGRVKTEIFILRPQYNTNLGAECDNDESLRCLISHHNKSISDETGRGERFSKLIYVKVLVEGNKV